eukprot:13445335-Alexandrium_andersonii.AAC.1
MSVGSIGAPSQVEQTVGQAGRELMSCLEDDLGGKVNASKSFLTTSRQSLYCSIVRRFGSRFPIKRGIRLKNLGIGCSQSHRNTQATAKRFSVVRSRVARAGRVRQGGARVGQLVRSGPSASALYGVSVTG